MATTEPPASRTQVRHPRPLGGDTARNLPAAAVSLSGMVLNNADHAIHTMRVGRSRSGCGPAFPGAPGSSG